MTDNLKERFEKMASFTCSCGCVSFKGTICKACGKRYKYGELDYDDALAAIEDVAGEIREEIKEHRKVIDKIDPRKATSLEEIGVIVAESIAYALEDVLYLFVGKAGDKPCNQPMKSVGDIGASTCKGRNPKIEGEELILTKLPRCPHGKAFCDWAGNRTMYDGCQPTENQEKEIAIILLGNRRDFASPKTEGGEKEAVA